MNKLKTLTILVLMFVSTVTAQEKQNDATWQETIDFIDDNISFIRGEACKFYVSCDSPDDTFVNYDIKKRIEKNNLILTFKHQEDGCGLNENGSIMILPLDKIREIRVEEKCQVKRIAIVFTGDYAIRKNGNNKIFRTFISSIEIEDKDMSTRIEKALNHLIYLSTEKRKKSKF